jgi:hypothetical protein
MNDILKFGLIGIGGYFLYEYLFGTSTPITTASSGTGTTPVAPSAAPATAASQLAQMESASLLTSSQWNYYERAASPNAVIILDGSKAGDTGAPMSFAAYQALAANPNALLSAPGSNSPLSGGEGLGMIIDLQKLFSGVPVGKGFGAREFSAGIKYGLSGLGLLIQSQENDYRRIINDGHLGDIVDDPLMSAAYIDEGVLLEAAAFGGSANDPTTKDFYLAESGAGV